MIIPFCILHKHFIICTLAKNDFFIKEGEKERFLYYIEKGSARLFAGDMEGKEYTFGFAFEDEFTNSYQSFTDGSLSQFNVQAITTVTAYKINQESLNIVLKQHSNSAFIYIKILENLFSQKIERELSLIRNTPEKNYLELVAKQPHIIQKIPLKHIASYIGITPQALSRIRKRIY